MLEAARHERNGAAWLIALSLGLRRGDVRGLRWQDVDLHDGTLTVRQAPQRLSW